MTKTLHLAGPTLVAAGLLLTAASAVAAPNAPIPAPVADANNEEQQKLAKAYIAQLDQARVFPKAIVTEVTPLNAFYRAEDYHQDYAYYNPNNPYIEVCDRPKIAALKQQFPELFIDYKPKK
jgi:hypothetical protein